MRDAVKLLRRLRSDQETLSWIVRVAISGL